eukprot:GHUV01053918.1.p1 GENE.GHUV01053918.1~~GHUV01053918.1.p1  ORF type:complete len:137 (-),score=29.26 GHUV01053918.1:62-472(-)
MALSALHGISALCSRTSNGADCFMRAVSNICLCHVLAAAQVTVAAGVHVLGRSLTIPLTVQNVQFHCIVRVTARPLLAYFPYIGEVGVSLMEAPHINFELPIGMLGGLDMMALPGIYGAMRLATRLAAKQFAVYPK